MNNIELMDVILLVQSAIGTFTGPTGGWISGPREVCEEIGVALRERYFTKSTKSPVQQPATKPDAFYKQYSEQDVPHGAMPPCRHFFRNSMSSEPGDYVCKSCGAIGVEISPDQQRALALRDVPQGQWISVKERLPEPRDDGRAKTQYVLIRTEDADHFIAFYDFKRKCWDDGDYQDCIAEVSHWMKIPELAARQVPVGPEGKK